MNGISKGFHAESQEEYDRGISTLSETRHGGGTGTEDIPTETVSFPDDDTRRACVKAMDILLQKDRTCRELSEKLRKAGFDDNQTAFALDYVRSYGYIDDERYAHRYVEFHGSQYSKRELKNKLRQRGVPSDTIDSVLSDYGVEDEQEALNSLIAKRLRGRSLSELEYEEKVKHVRYLTSKGFSIERIKEGLGMR